MTNLPAPVTTRFVARTDAIPDPGDLLDHAGTDGFVWLDGETGFVTDGVAARCPARDAAAVLASIEHIREPAAPDVVPRVVAALPFEGGGEVVLPARIVGRDRHGRAWRTTIDGAADPTPLRVTRAPASEFTVRPGPGSDTWHDTVRRAIAAIDAGDVEKVVLAREVEVEADEPFDVIDTLAQLRATQPGCTVYALDGFVGASPEVLVRRRGADVVSRPMAGTGTDPVELAASMKDAHEHRIVVDAIVASLADVCDDITADGPVAVAFATVTHLATTIRGRLRDPRVSALDLVTRLHPTPAVGGSPSERARALIGALEGRIRGPYAGACGWSDANGDGEFAVALRCAQLRGTHARLYAGAGIVAGSDPAAEWAETQAKLQPMLRALVRP